MIFLLTEYPKFCANCGSPKQTKDTPKYTLRDFEVGCSFSCSCGAQFQKIQDDTLVQLAEEGLLDEAIVEEL